MSEHRRREVVTYPAVFAAYNRPYVIASRTAHPDYPAQYIALGITTNAVTDGVELTEADWEVGELTKTSYIDPRYPVVLAAQHVVETVGALVPAPVDAATAKLADLIAAE